jgi:DNA-binding transcriptional LysR family regulator
VDKLQSIRAFTKVVQHGSFAAAARDMRLSRSAISKYVIDLEQELSTQLLVRTTRSAARLRMGRPITNAASKSWRASRRPTLR